MPTPEPSLKQLLTPHGNDGSPPSGLCLLEGLAVFRVTGADARDFLSRQLSCDVALLDCGHSVHGAWLSARGRVLALVRLVEHAGQVIMVLDDAVAEPAIARMRMFVLRSDVRIESARELAVVGLMNADRVAATLPRTRGAGVRAGATTPWNDVTLVSLDADDSRTLVLGPEPALLATCAALLAGGAGVDRSDTWEQLAVEAGDARLDAANIDTFVPQMLNLDRTDGISFSKGCYPGQEIVARTQHLGRIKRRMFRARLAHGEAVAPGSSVHGASNPDMAIGRVVRVAPGATGQRSVLAVIALDSVRAGDALSADGVALEDVSEPPYGLNPDSD